MSTARGIGSVAAVGYRSHWHVVAVAIAGFTGAWIERHALRTYFTADDLVALARAARLEHTPSMFRPLSAVLAAKLEYAAFGLAPLGYHLVNLGLFVLSTAGVYALAYALTKRWGTAAAAAVLFASSGIAFTVLHAASGIGDLLACVLLLGATLLHLLGLRKSRARWLWLAATVAALAVLAKESAVTWPLVALAATWLRGGPRRWSAAVPALVTAVVMLTWLMIAGRPIPVNALDPYALSFALRHLATNLATYLCWCAAIGTPIRDLVASPNHLSLPAGLIMAGALGWVLWWQRRDQQHVVALGMTWWLAFLLPVLPLTHHTYIYYLYIPWVGGAIAVAATGEAVARIVVSNQAFRAWRPARALITVTAFIAVAAFVLAEGRGIALRERATSNALPTDRTLREATLLEHAVPALQNTAFPPGTPVGFANPVPGAVALFPVQSRIEPGTVVTHIQYVPLEAALGGGRALRLFAPGLVDSGFVTTIPPGWDRVEWFLHEQRGWLRYWGHGQQALLRQAELQAAAGRWAAAESSFIRVRSLGDTVSAALCGEVVTLIQLGHDREASALTDTFAARWPADGRTILLREVRAVGRPYPRLIRPFDQLLPTYAVSIPPKPGNAPTVPRILPAGGHTR